MAKIKIYHEITIDDVTFSGNRLSSTTLTVTKLAYAIIDISLAISSTSQLMWTSGNGGITTFTQGMLLSDQDIYIERRNDDTGTVEFGLELVKANTPFWFTGTLGANTTESLDGATLVDNTDFADVDRIEVQNEGTTAAVISLFLFT